MLRAENSLLDVHQCGVREVGPIVQLNANVAAIVNDVDEMPVLGNHGDFDPPTAHSTPSASKAILQKARFSCCQPHTCAHGLPSSGGPMFKANPNSLNVATDTKAADLRDKISAVEEWLLKQG